MYVPPSVGEPLLADSNAAHPGTIISLFLIVVFRIVILLSLPIFFVACMYSFVWAVQIYRAVRRSRGSGLSVEYIIGTTVCRLFFLLCEYYLSERALFLLTSSPAQTSWDAPRTSWM